MSIVKIRDIVLADYANIITNKKGVGIFDLNGLLRRGNTKIPRTTAIFNMSSATDCPSLKLGLCKAYIDGKHICYAKKFERSHRPNVLPFRRRQDEFYHNITAEQFASQFILINALMKRKFTALRLNESGDFHDQQDLDKAETIARILKRYGVITYCYTSRSDLDYTHLKRLIISGSGFMKEGIKNEFKIVMDVKDRPKGYGVCAMNCKICTRCQKKGMKTVVKKH